MQNLRLQALRYAVAILADDSPAALLAALDAGLRPEHLQSREPPDHTPRQTPEYLLYRIALAHYEQHGQLPGAPLLEAYLRQLVPPPAPETVSAATVALGQLKHLPANVSDAQGLVDTLRQQHQRGMMAGRLLSLVRTWDTQPTSELARALQAVGEEVIAQAPEADVYDVAAAAGDRWAEYARREADPRSARGVMLGWSEFDRRSNGLRPAEVMVVAGNSAVGKSAFMVSSALSAWRFGSNAMLVNAEMANAVQHRRVEAMELSEQLTPEEIAGSLLMRLELGELGEAERQRYWDLLRGYSQREGRLWFVGPTAYRDLGDLEAIVARHKRREGLDLVCVDSLNLQTPPPGGRLGERHDLVLGANIKALSEIANRYEVAVITDCQSPPAVAGQREVTKEQAVGYSQMIVHHADDLIRLYELDAITLEAQVLKARNSEAMYSWLIYFDRPNMKMLDARRDDEDSG